MTYKSPNFQVLDQVRGIFDFSEDNVGYIYTVGVSQRFQRRGVAQSLLDKAATHLTKKFPATKALALHVAAYNESARKLYNKCNFVNLGTMEAYYCIGGEFYDGVLFARYLGGRRPPLEWLVFYF